MPISRRHALLVLGLAATAGRGARAQGTPIKVGIIGSGRIGGTLGTLWAKAGHPVMFSSRNPDSLQGLAQEAGPNASTGTPAQAAAFGDAVLVAVPYKALPQVGHELADAWRGKPVLDATNAAAYRDGAEMEDDVNKRGVGAVSAGYLPGVRLVRVFNSVAAVKIIPLSHRAELIALPLAGDDPAAVAMAEQLVRDAGFDPVLVGGLATAVKFQRGTPGFDTSIEGVTAPVLRQRLGLQ